MPCKKQGKITNQNNLSYMQGVRAYSLLPLFLFYGEKVTEMADKRVNLTAKNTAVPRGKPHLCGMWTEMLATHSFRLF